MPTEQRQVVKVFLASPSDLAAERKVAKEVVDKINHQWADFLSLHVELVGWEDSTSAYGRPQDTINQDLAQCEFFVGMLWHEWGKPNSRYKSGFEEEFRLSEKSLKKTGRPKISLLFKNMDPSRLRDPGPGLILVQKFKDEINGKILYKRFADESEFRERFEGVVTDYVQALKLAEQGERAQEAPAEDLSVPLENVPQKTEGQSQVSRDALLFVRNFASKAAKDSRVAQLSAEEIARFRLLGTMISEQGNDELLLGVHDANVLFASSGESSLTPEECAALVDCGLAHFDSENVPYWRFLEAVGGFHGDFIPVRTLYGPKGRRAGALKLMKLIRLEIEEEEGFGRRDYVDAWLDSSTPYVVREAALQYLSELGTSEDLQRVKNEMDRADSQTVKTARHAYVSIMLKQSAEKGLGALVEFQPESVEATLLVNVFARPAALSTKLLEQCLSHKASDLRAKVAEILRSRGLISRDAAEHLSTDPEANVRLQGLLARCAGGEVISEDQAKTILVRPKSTRSGLGSLIFSPSPTEGEAEFEKFKAWHRENLKSLDLRREISSGGIFAEKYVFEEIRRSFRTRGQELRAAVHDQFKTRFAEIFKSLEKVLSNAETLQKIRDLEETFRREWTRDALDIILSKRECEDLSLLRETIATGFIRLNEHDVNFLSQFGEWQDVKAILDFSKPTKGYGLSSLLSSGLSAAEIAWLAGAVLSIAKNRFRELLTLEMDSRIKAAVIAKTSGAGFRALTNGEVLDLLKSGDEGVRREAALKSVIVLPKHRVSSLLASHLALQTGRYYNVSTWLDLGVSTERARSTAIAKRAQHQS